MVTIENMVIDYQIYMYIKVKILMLMHKYIFVHPLIF